MALRYHRLNVVVEIANKFEVLLDLVEILQVKVRSSPLSIVGVELDHLFLGDALDGLDDELDEGFLGEELVVGGEGDLS